jgi:hypothetical protein
MGNFRSRSDRDFERSNGDDYDRCGDVTRKATPFNDNFDSGRSVLPVRFTVSPTIGATHLSAIGDRWIALVVVSR